MSHTSLILIVVAFFVTLGLGGYVGYTLHHCPIIEQKPAIVTVTPGTVKDSNLTTTHTPVLVPRPPRIVHDTIRVANDSLVWTQSYSLNKTIEIPVEAHVSGAKDTTFRSTMTQDVTVSFTSAPINEFTELEIRPHTFTIPGTLTEVVRTEYRQPWLWYQVGALWHGSTGGGKIALGVSSVSIGAGFLINEKPLFEATVIHSF
jgi:hypothetical protein